MGCGAGKPAVDEVHAFQPNKNRTVAVDRVLDAEFSLRDKSFTILEPTHSSSLELRSASNSTSRCSTLDPTVITLRSSSMSTGKSLARHSSLATSWAGRWSPTHPDSDAARWSPPHMDLDLDSPEENEISIPIPSEKDGKAYPVRGKAQAPRASRERAHRRVPEPITILLNPGGPRRFEQGNYPWI